MPTAPQSLPPPRLIDVWRICRDYRKTCGRFPNLLRPRRFTEKMQWRKLFDLNPVYAVVLDKLAAREFAAARIGDGWFAPLLWSGDSPDDIPFDRLAPPYVLKCNHGSGFNIIVEDDAALDRAQTRATLNSWLATSYGARYREPGYMPIRPRVFVERLMREADGTTPLEFKIFVFHGRVRIVQTVLYDHSRDRKRFAAIHDRDWRDLRWLTNSPLYDRELPRPRRLDDFLALAERLGAGFDHLRVDMYEWMGEPRVGELTVYNWSGIVRFDPDEADFILGDWWRLRISAQQALAAFLSPRR